MLPSESELSQSLCTTDFRYRRIEFESSMSRNTVSINACGIFNEYSQASFS